jgi:hypothetical protein
MARYDRIAPLNSPIRDQAFPCWPVLRDLEGQERDADACRRARLRFLALRPVRRLADTKFELVSPESFSRQLEAVRDELRSLNSHDAERVRINRFLRQIEEREPKRIVMALLEFAEQAHAAGHVHAAQEYAATADDVVPGAATALRARMQADTDAHADDAAVLESAWNELRNTDNLAQRAVALERIGRALMGLQLLTPADRCFTMVTQRQADLTVRSRARSAHALVAAMQDQGDTFRSRRTALLGDSAEWSADPRVAATVHADLAHACVLTGDLDYAREHVRSAITIARRHNFTEPLARAEHILTALEQNTEVLLPERAASTEVVQRIVAQIEAFELPTPAV